MPLADCSRGFPAGTSPHSLMASVCQHQCSEITIIQLTWPAQTIVTNFLKCFRCGLKQFQEFLKLSVPFLVQSECLQTNFSSSVAGGLCSSRASVACPEVPATFPWHFWLVVCHACVHPRAIKGKSFSLLSK